MTDGGAHWQTIKSPKMVSLFGIIFLNKNNGFTVGEFSTILATTDGGQNWTLAYGGNTGDFTVGSGVDANDWQHNTSGSVSDDFTWIKGSHQMAFGGNFMRAVALSLANVYSIGNYSVTGAYTGSGLGDANACG